MTVKIEDVAERAGVSVTTVSRVMNNRGAISEKTREKVMEAIHELDYHPSQIARNLFKQKSHIIGVIVPDVSHNFYGSEVKHIERNLCEAGYRLLLCNTKQQKTLEQDYIDMLQCNKVDGIIIASHTQESEAYQQLHLPLVSIDRNLGADIPVVSSNHYQGGILAAEELLRCQCKTVVQVVCDTSIPKPSDERHIAFKTRLGEAGIRCEEINIPLNTFDFDDYIKVSNTLFDTYPKVDGVFCADNIACAVLKTAVQREYAVPKQMKIVGYDGNDIAKMVTPTLTTIRQQTEIIAKTAVDILLRRVEGSEVTGTYKIPVQFVQGETTAV
ncbi:LacI family DNA-binding transcriptional regulator [Hungatella sp. L12]|uniref:LacI family DNA-binding transcriptional regulator n=1 Tax=Hungatella hominis TaxID=2763050 RepID=A0ABR7H9M8_9FIRM|nr:LacI family DNA-binding transcriptional regulator [Hungatella hominis]MBC5709903.1 LacI family DNA-binding transcriptional regulator [Hungatella hominis]